MDCAYKCMEYLLKKYKIENEGLLQDIKKQTTSIGISIYHLIELCKKYDFPIGAYKSYRLKHKCPYILYLRGSISGHFVVVERAGTFFIQIYDPELKSIKRNKLFLYIRWAYIVLIVL